MDIPIYASPANRSMSAISQRRKRSKQAHLCQHRRQCLDIAVEHELLVLPCDGCRQRHDLNPWELRDDPLNCLMLIVAIFYPGRWKLSQINEVRRTSFDDSGY